MTAFSSEIERHVTVIAHALRVIEGHQAPDGSYWAVDALTSLDAMADLLPAIRRTVLDGASPTTPRESDATGPTTPAQVLAEINRLVQVKHLPAPHSVSACGAVSLRFADDEKAAVDQWAAALGLETSTYDVGPIGLLGDESWVVYSAESSSRSWMGWTLTVSCRTEVKP